MGWTRRGAPADVDCGLWMYGESRADAVSSLAAGTAGEIELEPPRLPLPSVAFVFLQRSKTIGVNASSRCYVSSTSLTLLLLQIVPSSCGSAAVPTTRPHIRCSWRISMMRDLLLVSARLLTLSPLDQVHGMFVGGPSLGHSSPTVPTSGRPQEPSTRGGRAITLRSSAETPGHTDELLPNTVPHWPFHRGPCRTKSCR
jgi:hypothetical protein